MVGSNACALPLGFLGYLKITEQPMFFVKYF
jgi:hypothetical protein